MEVRYLYNVVGTSSRRVKGFSTRVPESDDLYRFRLDILLESKLTMGLIPEMLKIFGYSKPDEAEDLMIESVNFVCIVPTP